jgi:hypothetical protein
MAATGPTIDREVPGGGKLKPVNHIVRIVVVPPDNGTKSASQNGGHGHSHGLTDHDRKTAQDKLTKMEPPPRDPSEREAARSPKPKTMFEALKSTDIVVVGLEPASVRTVDSEGNPKKRELDPHNDRNKDTVLRVWTESDTIEYQCDEPFEIVRVEQAGWKIYGAPDDPFGIGGPYTAQQRPRAQGQNPLWVWRSGLLPARANNQQYKMTFRIGGVEIDPDVACGDPPPR